MKPCPFCGSHMNNYHIINDIASDRSNDIKTWYIQLKCMKCSAAGPIVEDENYTKAHKQAAEKWNERTERN